MALHLGPRTRRILKILGLALLFVVTFVFALQATFPYDRVKAKVIEALSTKYDVTIGDVERGIMPGSMTFKAMTLRSRPSKPGEIPTVFFVERLELHLGLLALTHHRAELDLDAKIGAGHITGEVAIADTGTGVHLHGRDLPSVGLPMRDGIGLPMSGKVDFDVDLDLPATKDKFGKVGSDWSKAEGAMAFSCLSGCTIGDGKTKLKPKLNNNRNAAFAADGIEFGTLKFDRLVAEIQFSHGRAEFKKFETKSADGELHVEVGITLQPEFGESLISGCLRFKGTDVLLKREPKTFAAIQTTGAPLGPDGLFHIRLDGRVKDGRRLGQVCGSAAGVGMDDVTGGAGRRPTVTVQPDPPPPTVTIPPPTSSTPPNPPPTITPPAAGSAAVPIAPAQPTTVPVGNVGGAGTAGSAAPPPGTGSAAPLPPPPPGTPPPASLPTSYTPPPPPPGAPSPGAPAPGEPPPAAPGGAAGSSGVGAP